MLSQKLSVLSMSVGLLLLVLYAYVCAAEKSFAVGTDAGVAAVALLAVGVALMVHGRRGERAVMASMEAALARPTRCGERQ